MSGPERIAALEVKCDLLSASLRKADAELARLRLVEAAAREVAEAKHDHRAWDRLRAALGLVTVRMVSKGRTSRNGARP